MRKYFVWTNLLSIGFIIPFFGAPDAVAATVGNGSIITLKNGGTGDCLSVTGSSAGGGAKAQGQACSSSSFQQWKAVADANGAYQLINVGSGLCLDDPGASTATGTAIQQWGCGGGAWQKWQFKDAANGYANITSVASGLYLDEDPGSSTGAVHQWTATGNTNQQWMVTSGSGSTSTGPIGFGAGTTGGAGGPVVTVTKAADLASALCATASNGVCTDSAPRIIRISGILNFRNTEGTRTELGCTYSANSCSVNGKSEQILNYANYCSGKSTHNITYDAAGKTPLLVGSNKTVIGVGVNSGIMGKGLALHGGVSNIIIRNLSLTDMNDGVIWAADAITMDNASQVWIDHNYFARIGRQMIVAGWGPAKNVDISGNYFDGTSDYGHWCNGRAYWTMLLNGANQTITLAGNRFHNTSGRGPETGKPSSAASTGIIHIVNNYYDSTEYFTGGLSSTNVVSILVEGNYYAQGDYFFPIMDTTANKTDTNSNWNFAPVSGNIARANNTCNSVLGRDCVANVDDNGKASDFLLNPTVMSNIQGSGSAVQAIKSVIPADPSTVANQTFGPQANIGQ
ncbi:RICIN domain-containing protein [Collimonas silvisoli]|uniref:RICIN domain-containing protein n=1 Tax=Collimonas silvisoli TaxID=2825884 RepID=UPI001B8CE05F|nr:RICIN domain-containing protein [Collimonas silvisoli]